MTLAQGDGRDHLGEWIAAQVFDIEPCNSASNPAFDGTFQSGPLWGETVNVKWYLKREGILDLTSSNSVQHYLALTGPTGAAVSTRGVTRPWVIHAVYLFDTARLRRQLDSAGRKSGTATSVRNELWEAAEIYPGHDQAYPVDEGQRRALELLHGRRGCQDAL